jgi:3-hydroxybutyrate dehydrogenase
MPAAVITGADGDIGQALSESFLADGLTVFGGDIVPVEPRDGLVPVRLDVTVREAVFALAERAAAEAGPLKLWINAAGIVCVVKVLEATPEDWHRIIAVNLTGTFHGCAAALEVMRRQGGGRIVNVASAHGLVGSPFKSAYVAAKHGILGLTKVVALETAEAGITCNAICPGYVYTPLVEAQIAGQAEAHGIPREQVIRDVLLAQQPNKRFASIEEIGALTLFLASDAAASITGAALPVDGGWTAH